MEQVFIVPVIIVGSIVWLSLGYYGGRMQRKYFAQKYPVLRKTNDDWETLDEVVGVILILGGLITAIVVVLIGKLFEQESDPYPDIFTSPMKPRYKSIFGNGGES